MRIPTYVRRYLHHLYHDTYHALKLHGATHPGFTITIGIRAQTTV